MAKYLLLALVVIWLFYSPALRRRRGSPNKAATQPNPRATPSGTPKEHSTQTMVRCAHCGVHLPSSEALLDDQQAPYCSHEHQRAGPRSA
jgi:uncharacterized protein